MCYFLRASPASSRLPSTEMRASYLSLIESGELHRRAGVLKRMLGDCNICPLDCRVNRLANEISVCHSGRLPVVSAFTPHFGEEPALTGTRGAGNIFLGHCNLRCVYCQNFQISQNYKVERRNEVTIERLAEIMLDLQERGCHNINWVSPTHFVPQLVRALELAADRGLELPVVYNTNAYDSVEVLRLLDGIVDVYLPDLKYADNQTGWQLSKIASYADHARTALKEMYRQLGDEPVYSADGLLQRGLVIRLLVLPNDLAGIRESLEWIRSDLSAKVNISLMAQFYPANKTDNENRYVLLSRKIRPREWYEAVEAMESLGFENGWIQDFQAAAEYYRPDFSNPGEPFKDVRDFKTA